MELNHIDWASCKSRHQPLPANQVQFELSWKDLLLLKTMTALVRKVHLKRDGPPTSHGTPKLAREVPEMHLLVFPFDSPRTVICSPPLRPFVAVTKTENWCPRLLKTDCQRPNTCASLTVSYYEQTRHTVTHWKRIVTKEIIPTKSVSGRRVGRVGGD